MTDTIKVFKNVNAVSPSAGEESGATPLDINLVTTTASQRAVIKDVDFAALGTGKDRVFPILDLNGHAYKTGANGALSCEGNIIVGPSSTLSIKSATTSNSNPTGGFKGMAFFEGSSGIQKLTGDGVTSTPGSSMSPVKLNSANTACDDAVAAVPPSGAPGGGDGIAPWYYRTYNNVIYKYNVSGSMVANWSHGSTGYSLTADDTYLYRGHSGGGTTIWRTRLSDHNYTTLNTATSWEGPGGNQGSIFVHHDGKIYTRNSGPNNYLDIIDLTTLSVIRKTSSDFSLGSYSDGGCAVTTLAGKSYIVEVGDGWFYYYDITGSTVTRTAIPGHSTSTEYAQGGGEIAPGVALVFGEQSDRATVVDMNTITATTDTGSHGYTTDTTYGNRFGFAAYLEAPSEFTYSAYAAGIEIT